MPTQIYMHTLGCPKNRVDSEIMLGTLAEAGYRLVQEPRHADVIVVNTCGFIESAKEESVQAILELSRMKEEGRCKKLVVAGCLTQRYPDEMAREMPEVDHFVGTGAYADIAAIVSDAQARRVIVPDPDFVHSASTPRVNSLASHTAYLKIAEGCDNACAFCIIPTLRGAQRSRPVADVVAEAQQLAEQGAVEHMNEDHREAMNLYATSLLGAEPGDWRCTGCDPDCMDMQAGAATLRLDFPERVTSAMALRKMLVRLAGEARARADEA